MTVTSSLKTKQQILRVSLFAKSAKYEQIWPSQQIRYHDYHGNWPVSRCENSVLIALSVNLLLSQGRLVEILHFRTIMQQNIILQNLFVLFSAFLHTILNSTCIFSHLFVDEKIACRIFSHVFIDEIILIGVNYVYI